MKKILIVVALFAFGATATFAQNAPTMPATTAAKTEQTAKPEKGKKAKKVKVSDVEMFQCPMKCEPARDYAGKCPKCLMDLVSVNPPKKKAADGHAGHTH